MIFHWISPRQIPSHFHGHSIQTQCRLRRKPLLQASLSVPHGSSTSYSRSRLSFRTSCHTTTLASARDGSPMRSEERSTRWICASSITSSSFERRCVLLSFLPSFWVIASISSSLTQHTPCFLYSYTNLMP